MADIVQLLQNPFKISPPLQLGTKSAVKTAIQSLLLRKGAAYICRLFNPNGLPMGASRPFQLPVPATLGK